MTYFGLISRPEWPLILLAYIGTLLPVALLVWLFLPDAAARARGLAQVAYRLGSKAKTTSRHGEAG